MHLECSSVRCELSRASSLRSRKAETIHGGTDGVFLFTGLVTVCASMEGVPVPTCMLQGNS
jgi:hypothetical protein